MRRRARTDAMASRGAIPPSPLNRAASAITRATYMERAPIRAPSGGTKMAGERVKKVAVIGAGSMGAGIAQVCSQAGLEVAMRDIEQRFVDGGFRRIRDPLMKRVEKGKMAREDVDRVLANIRGTVSLKEAVAGAQLVIEAIIEKMDAKKALFSELDALCPPEVVFASNTSSLSITEMASATRRAPRVIGMHFFN